MQELTEILTQACRDGRFVLGTVDSAQTLGGDALRQEVERLRARLRAAACPPGAVVLFHGEQGAAAFCAFWACVLEALVFAPVDPAWPEFLLGRTCARLHPACVVAERPGDQPWHRLLPGCAVLAAEDPAASAIASTPVPPVPAAPAAPALLLCTSGSTGDPKIVVLSREVLADSARRVAGAFGWEAGEVLLNLPEPHTMSGLRNALIVAPLLGMHWLVLPPRQRPHLFALLEVISSRRVNRLVAAPLLLRQINLLGDRVPREGLASLRAVYCTGADLHPAEVRRFHAQQGVTVINYYGLTETAGLCLSQDPGHWTAADDSLGWPVGCEARLVDADGVLPPGPGKGELQVRMAGAAPHYLADAAATALLHDGDWIRTGDLMRRDEQGRYRLLGRTSLFIKTTSTDCVSPQEIEAVLEQHPAVLEAAVAGRADAHGGERIEALLVLREGIAGDWEREMADFVRERLGAGRVPRRFQPAATIPRNASGKILRKQLSELIAHD